MQCHYGWIGLARIFCPIFRCLLCLSDPNVVYAKDMTDIEYSTGLSAADLSQQDKESFAEFGGVASYSWQQDILDTVFDELNPFDDDTLDLQENYTPPPLTVTQKIFPCCRPPSAPVFDEGSLRLSAKQKGFRKPRGLYASSITSPPAARAAADSYRKSISEESTLASLE
eukprot:m.617440 g.617440  ORF g.617440 m.617440 type:complete len:170 (+) comp58180_c0_seq3:1547-2056(+)